VVSVYVVGGACGFFGWCVGSWCNGVVSVWCGLGFMVWWV
jgi:hypothetical protein